MKFKKPKVGQSLWVESLSPHSSHVSKEAKVTKVGRKYFEVEEFWGRFKIENFYHDIGYSPEYRAWESLQDMEDNKLYGRLWEKITKAFHWEHKPKETLSLSQLKRISEILEEEN